MPKTVKPVNPILPAAERLNRFLLQLAHLCDVPSALVMRVYVDEIEVYASAATEDTPYKVGDKEPLNSGLYCEHVMAKRAPLLVPDATQDPTWCNNPDIKLGMISYLGFPLKWPDGRVFGTICILDRKRNEFSPKIEQTIDLFRSIVEDQLALVFETQRTKDALSALEANRQELSQAVRLAVDATVTKAKLVESISKDLSLVLQSLLPFLEDPAGSKTSGLDVRGHLLEIASRINNLSDQLTPRINTLTESAHKKRIH